MTNVTEKLYRICFMSIRYLLFLINVIIIIIVVIIMTGTRAMSLTCLRKAFFISFSFWFWPVSIRLKSLLIFAGKQARMGACQIAPVRAI